MPHIKRPPLGRVRADVSLSSKEEPRRGRFVTRDRSRGLSAPSRPWPAEGHPPSGALVVAPAEAAARALPRSPTSSTRLLLGTSPGARSELGAASSRLQG